MSRGERVHATCIALGGRGVLLSGRSGSGKSDLALRLIDRGAVLVSDDYTELAADGALLKASPPERIAGLIEIRGVGIRTVAYQACAPVALLVDLDGRPQRLPGPTTRTLCGLCVPCIALPALEPSAPIKVEIALQLHGLDLPCPP